MFFAALLALVGCDDTIFPPVSRGGSSGEGGFCGVQSIFAGSCVSCHGASGGGLGGLDLVTDPHAALVGAASANWAGRTLVVPGDPDASLLYAKVAGLQDPTTEGGAMPPTGALGAADVEVIRAWIADGASDVCDSEDTASEGYHPPGWEAPTAHGLEAKLNTHVQPCTSCHGEDLTGGEVAISCDDCHAATSEDWRTDCTFCHGGADDLTGAPPEGIRDETDAGLLAFPPHATHVQATDLKVAFDCVQCHVKPAAALDIGHVLVGDTSPGLADVAFGTLAGAAVWNTTTQTCSNVYCHGDGQGDNGTVVATDSVACGDCHAVSESDREPRWDDMSGAHEEHLDEGMTCSECHGEVINGAGTIAHVEKHVNGVADVLLASGMTRVGNGCSGTCHDEFHNPDVRKWED